VFRKEGAERGEDAGEIAEDVHVAQSKDRDSKLPQGFVAPGVVVPTSVVHSAVDFDRDLESWAVEIEDEPCKDVLTSKAPADLSLPQTRPQASFGASRSGSHLSCSLNLCRRCADTRSGPGIAASAHT